MATYYIDPEGGNDAADGLTAGAAKQDASLLTLADDDELYFKCDTQWLVSTVWQVQNAARVQVGNYGSGQKPEIGASFDGDTAAATIHVFNRTGWRWEGLKISRPLPTSDIGRATLEVRGTGSGHLFRNMEFSGGSDGFRIINNVAGCIVEDCEIYGAYNDAVWIQCGDGTILRRNRIYGYGVGVALCDGIQASEHTGSLYIDDNGIIMPAVSTKQAIHCTSVATSPTTYVRRNRVHNPGSSTGSLLSVEGNGVIERNYVTGNVGNGISLVSRAVGQRMAIARHNVIVSDWASNLYGILIQGAHEKDIVVAHNTLIGRWTYGVYILSTAMPTGSTYTGGNNVIDCRDKALSYAFRNESADTAATTVTDRVYRAVNTVNSQFTADGVTTGDPMVSASGRPLPGSPLIGAGTHLGYSRDLNGVQRPNPPSIGAYDVATLRTPA